MAQHTIRAVLLDYGGVIADEGFQNTLRALSAEQGLDGDATLQVAKVAVYESGFVLGQGSENDFWNTMRAGAGLQGSDDELTRRVLRGFVLRDWMIGLVRQWNARGLITGILSDQMLWLDWLDERDRFFAHFSLVFNSYHMGKGKRDPSLFDDIAERLALAPRHILFVDDMKSNIERARGAGWHAIHYVDRRDFLRRLDDYLPAPQPA